MLSVISNGQILYLLPYHYYWWKRFKDIEDTPQMSVSPCDTTDVIQVHMLTGVKQHVDLLYAAKSFLLHYGSPASVVVHGDSSVEEEHIERIKRHLPGVKVFSKKERDEIVEPELEIRGLKKCAEFRRSNVLAAKVIDTHLLATAKRILILDTDCLFFKPPQELRQLAAQAHMPSVVSKDPSSCPYSLPLDKLNEYFSISMKPNINSGLCLIETSLVDLELVEKWLSTPGCPVTSYFAEQTIIAGLVSRSNMMMLSDEYNVGRLKDEASCKFIHYCGHYLGSTRLAMKRTGQAIILKQLQAVKNS